MQIENVLIVLGKRLQANQLTAEGLSRAEALTDLIPSLNLANTAVILCGGVTKGQTVSEADAMASYVKKRLSSSSWQALEPNLIIENRSINTIENIENAAQALIDSKLCHTGQYLNVTLLSNDYHLQRILEIQTLLDEQGLLRVLKQRCLAMGIELEIPLAIEEHVAITYPHHTEVGRLFLIFDELSTFRVYLEGVVKGNLDVEDKKLRQPPVDIALEVFNKLSVFEFEKNTQADIETLTEASHAFITAPSVASAQRALNQVHPLLTKLKDQFDPEVTLFTS